MQVAKRRIRQKNHPFPCKGLRNTINLRKTIHICQASKWFLTWFSSGCHLIQFFINCDSILHDPLALVSDKQRRKMKGFEDIACPYIALLVLGSQECRNQINCKILRISRSFCAGSNGWSSVLLYALNFAHDPSMQSNRKTYRGTHD